MDFKRINIPQLQVLSTEESIKTIRNLLDKLSDWKNLKDLIPINFRNTKSLRKTGQAGMFVGALELAKEGNLMIKQNKLFDDIFIKQK